MARNVTVHLLDDLDGSAEDVKTVSFTYKGVQYRVDLSKANREDFDAAMAVYIRVATRYRGNPATRGKLGYGNAKAIRAWAKDQPEWEKYGKPTGRLPDRLIAEYYEWVSTRKETADE